MSGPVRTREYVSGASLDDVDEEEDEARRQRQLRMVNDEQLVVSDVHSRNLRLLERKAHQIQYLLACLSTLGGAHHLCNKPQQALQLAIRQEYLGYTLGSTQVIVRARVFQAVNHALLGRVAYSRRYFQRILESAEAEERWNSGLAAFVRASMMWLEMELGERRKAASEK